MDFVALDQNAYAHKITGLSQVFLDLTRLQSLSETLNVLAASAAGVPFIFARKIEGKLHYDSDYIPSIPALSDKPSDTSFLSVADTTSTTLTLLTKHFEEGPMLFGH